jgi:pheromone shutdown-related protein TraB
VVAVLGAGHIPGIKKCFGKHVDIALLEEIPPTHVSIKFLSWGIPIFILLLIGFGFYNSGHQTSIEMIKAWIIINGSLSALGAILALAHPITIVTAFIAAPITSLNPTIAAGTVCGLVEAFLRKPRVKDFETVGDDIATLKGLWHNRLARIFLVFLLTSVGSAIGTFLGAGSIIAML